MGKEIENIPDNIIPFEERKRMIGNRQGVIAGVNGLLMFLESDDLKALFRELGDTLIGTPMGESYQLICSEENLYADDSSYYVDGEVLVVKTNVYGEIQPLTKEDLAVIDLFIERRIVIQYNDKGVSYPAILLQKKRA